MIACKKVWLKTQNKKIITKSTSGFLFSPTARLCCKANLVADGYRCRFCTYQNRLTSQRIFGLSRLSCFAEILRHEKMFSFVRLRSRTEAEVQSFLWWESDERIPNVLDLLRHLEIIWNDKDCQNKLENHKVQNHKRTKWGHKGLKK